MAALRKTHGAGTGRPRKPAPCRKCGAPCPSMREARAHCVGKLRWKPSYGRVRSTERYPVLPPQLPHGTLVLGSPEKFSEAEERVPMYLEAVRDLVRVALTLSFDGQGAPLHFVPATATPRAPAQESQPAGLTVAWLEGISLPAGERLLLGYVAGTAGATTNLKAHVISARRLR
jgi:hypothetical protein